LISQDVTELRGVRLVPVETPPVRPVVMDLANSISRALESRPEYLQELHNVERQNILVAFNRNQLWPQVDLEGSYGLTGAAARSAIE
jgi:outer membrane protein TolC